MNPKNRKILIVDVNISIHDDFKRFLQPASYSHPNPNSHEAKKIGIATLSKTNETQYELASAYQGLEAIDLVQLAEATGTPFALAFVDMRMPPGIDGLETIKKIWEVSPLMEVVLCTSYPGRSLAEITEYLGDTKRLLILKKPYDPVEIKQMAASLTEKWSYTHEAKYYLENLESLLNERTKSLDHERSMRIQALKMAALGEMAGGIAHEINNPLTIIYGNANRLMEIISRNPIDLDKLCKITTKILNTSKRISRIIQSMLSSAHSHDNRGFQNILLKTIFDDCFDICHEKFKSRGIKVELTDFNLDGMIECDHTQLVQAFINLLNNAHDALAELDCENRWVRIEVNDHGDQYEIRFIDSGTGIPDFIANKILEPFFTTKAIGKGTGIGLSLAKSFINDHQGSLILDRNHSHTCFTVRLHKKLP